jgi:hypothetical protein
MVVGALVVLARTARNQAHRARAEKEGQSLRFCIPLRFRFGPRRWFHRRAQGKHIDLRDDRDLDRRECEIKEVSKGFNTDIPLQQGGKEGK